MGKHLLSVVAFMIVTFVVQGGSHFAINTDHYAAISFMRPEPIMIMGLGTMVLQGFILTLALGRLTNHATIRNGIVVSLTFGLFLGSYIALTSPAKYAVPSIAAWFTVEAMTSLIQFSVFGVLLGWIHRMFSTQEIS